MSYRFAIIGCGSIAQRHADQIRNLGSLLAVCDVIPERAAALAHEYKAKAYTDLQTLLTCEPVDIVAVCTPNGLHATHSIQALQAGCHVICEKPMAISSLQAQEMIAAAETAGRRLFVVKQNRHNPAVVIVKKLLSEGRLGAISGFQINGFWNRPQQYYHDSWRGSMQLDGGLLFTQFSHFIDLLYWFLGGIRQASGFRSRSPERHYLEFEDTGAASLLMKRGMVGTLQYTINAHQSNMEGSFTLFGERGTIKIGGQYLNTIDHFSVEGEQPPAISSGQPANNYGFYTGSMSNHHLVYRQLVKALDDPAELPVEAREGLKTIEMIEQIYASSPLIQPGGQP